MYLLYLIYLYIYKLFQKTRQYGIAFDIKVIFEPLNVTSIILFYSNLSLKVNWISNIIA